MRKIVSVFILAVLGMVGCSQSINLEEHFSLNGTVGSLAAMNQNNEEVDIPKDYKDKIWLAAFIFTNCDTVCPPMTMNMATLQKQAKQEHLDVEFVSFTIDPENDKPDVLKNFAKSFGADETNWNFLTGYDQEVIESFANTSYIAPAAKLDGSNQFVHSSAIYLMKGTTILEQYEVSADVPYEKIIEDIKLLQ